MLWDTLHANDSFTQKGESYQLKQNQTKKPPPHPPHPPQEQKKKKKTGFGDSSNYGYT